MTFCACKLFMWFFNTNIDTFVREIDEALGLKHTGIRRQLLGGALLGRHRVGPLIRHRYLERACGKILLFIFGLKFIPCWERL